MCDVTRTRVLARRCSMGTVIIVRRRTVLLCDVVTRCGGGRACVNRLQRRGGGVAPFMPTVSQSVGPGRVWLCVATWSLPPPRFAGWFSSQRPPPGPRLLTDITCATADQPTCHVIATAAHTERSLYTIDSCLRHLSDFIKITNYQYFFIASKVFSTRIVVIRCYHCCLVFLILI